MNRETKIMAWALGITVAVLVGVGVLSHDWNPRPAEAPRAAPAPLYPAPQADAEPHAWFVVDMTGTECFTPEHATEASPAAWIKSERDNGESPETKENRDSDGNLESVEISISVSEGLQTRVWTYYRSKSVCEQAIQKRNHIPDEYK